VLEDRVELPRLYMAWHTPAMFEPDDAELDLVGDLVANGKTARLYKSLVFEDRIALDVSAAQQSRELGSVFVLAATALRARRWPTWPAGSTRRWCAWPATARSRPRWSAAAPRSSRTSSTGCRRWADSAASPTS
jgi:hypothetical protein